MGYWKVNSHTLARGRFAVSPLAETLAAVMTLRARRKDPGLEEWLRAHQRRFREYVDSDPFVPAFLDAAFHTHWNADFVVQPPLHADRTFHAELRHVRETPREVALRDLGVSRAQVRGTPLDVPDLTDRCADVLEWVWSRTVRPDWPRRRAILESDIVARTHQLSTRGWAAALDGMRPGMRWLGDGRLRINAYDNPPRDIGDAELLFVPVTSRGGWVGWDEPHRYLITYPCSGVLVAQQPATSSAALRRLLGPARAIVLALLDAPRSTSQLVAVTGYGLGSVGGHLRVMLDAGLVRRRRSGRSVLYYRTPLGDDLVHSES